MLAELVGVLTLALLGVGLYLTAPTTLFLTVALVLLLVPLAQRIPERWSWRWQKQHRDKKQ